MYVNPDHQGSSQSTHITPMPQLDGPGLDFGYGYAHGRIKRCSSTSSMFSNAFEAHHSMSRRSLPHMRRPFPTVFNGERPQGSSNRSDLKSPRPSVVHMKELMPLRLSSAPMRPEEDSKRPMHGSWPLQEEPMQTRDGRDSDATSLTTDRSSLSTTHSSDSFRDIPYYMNSGLPSPSRVYFTNEDSCFKCLPPGSPCRISCVVADYQHASNDEELYTDCAEDFDHDCDESDKSQATSYNSSRASGLSIQCLGQPMVAHEALWLGNNMSLQEQRPGSGASCDDESDATSISSLDSGMSRWTPPLQHSEVFEHATALSPAKAHVVHVRKSSVASLSYPARFSSLHITSKTYKDPETPEFCAPRCFSSYHEMTPPHSPEDAVVLNNEAEEYSNTPRASHHPPQKSYSNVNVDFAFSSPPNSPSHTISSQLSYNNINLTPNYSSSSISSAYSAHYSFVPLTPPMRSLLTAIANAIEGFPSTMLLPNSSCVEQIRQLCQVNIRKASVSSSASTNSLSSVEDTLETPRRKSKATRLFSPMASASTKCFKQSKLNDMEDAKPLNLHPLQRIFPSTTEFMRGVLYAHLLAYNFVGEVLAGMDGAGERRMPSKAARLMGVEQSGEDVGGIVEGLRDVIHRLVGGMGGEVTGGLIVCLGEVVRLCEE